MGRLILIGAAVAAAAGPGGCVNISVKGDAATYSIALWVWTLALLISIVATPAGWLLRRRYRRAGWPLLCIGLVLLLVVAPGLMSDHVKLDSRHFALKTGFWFAPTRRNVEFSQLDQIVLVTREERGRRGRRITKQDLECVYKTGQSVRVPIGDLMKYAVIDILEEARGHGVVIDERDERPAR